MKKLKELLHMFLLTFMKVLADFFPKVPMNGSIWKYPTKQKVTL